MQQSIYDYLRITSDNLTSLFVPSVLHMQPLEYIFEQITIVSLRTIILVVSRSILIYDWSVFSVLGFRVSQNISIFWGQHNVTRSWLRLNNRDYSHRRTTNFSSSRTHCTSHSPYSAVEMHDYATLAVSSLKGKMHEKVLAGISMTECLRPCTAQEFSFSPCNVLSMLVWHWTEAPSNLLNDVALFLIYRPSAGWQYLLLITQKNLVFSCLQEVDLEFLQSWNPIRKSSRWLQLF